MSERPFNSENKYMAVSGAHSPSGTTINDAPREIYYLKGSIEVILERCRFYYVSDDSTPGLDAATRSVIITRALRASAKGLRVIAMAYGYGSVAPDSSGIGSLLDSSLSKQKSQSAPSLPKESGPTSLVFVGFQAIFDPPRKGVVDAMG